MLEGHTFLDTFFCKVTDAGENPSFLPCYNVNGQHKYHKPSSYRDCKDVNLKFFEYDDFYMILLTNFD